MTTIADDNTPFKRLVEQADGDVPNATSGGQNLFIDEADHKLKRKDSSGTVEEIETAAGQTRDYILIRDQKAQNTDGGTFTSGSWQTRTLNTEVSDAGGHASISSNQITLAAGTYECSIICPAYAVNRHQARLQNITDTSTTLIGTSMYMGVAAGDGVSASIIKGTFTIAGSKTFEVQHQCQTTKTDNGFCFDDNFTTEIYTIAEFWKVS